MHVDALNWNSLVDALNWNSLVPWVVEECCHHLDAFSDVDV